MKNRFVLLTGFSLFLCFSLLVAGGTLGKMVYGSYLAWAILLAELVAFLIPTMLVAIPLRRAGTIKLPLRTNLKFSDLRLSARIGMSMALFSFLINLLIAHLSGQTIPVFGSEAISGIDVGRMPLLYLFAVAIIPAVLEELFLRGTVFTVFTRFAGTGMCMVLTSLSFAMLHGSLQNFIGPLISGFAFCWLVFIFESIWPCVLAHTVSNIFYLFVLWITDTYGAFGILRYFSSVGIVLFLLFTYLSLRSIEQILAEGRVPNMNRGQSNIHALQLIVGNPAFIAFIVAFMIKIVFGIL